MKSIHPHVCHMFYSSCCLTVRVCTQQEPPHPASGSGGSGATSGTLLQGHLSTAVPDMSPFFLKGYVKVSHSLQDLYLLLLNSVNMLTCENGVTPCIACHVASAFSYHHSIKIRVDLCLV